MSKAKVIEGALPPGTVIRSSVDGFRVESVLGAGGFGITYRVTRLSDGRVFAMKEYFPDKLCERGEGNTLSYLKTNAKSMETGLKDFITEAERLNRQNISHPNIVAVDSVFRANNTAYYTMEFIDGSNLLQYVIKRNGGRPLSVAQTLSVMRPVLQAVALLHAHNLTHLDLKHENILLTFESDGSLRPVIIDFGQSKHYDKKGHATSQLTNAGCSDGFAPPEQYQGLVTFTPQADVYALSATILYLLTARQPVSSADISAAKIAEALSPNNVPDRIVDALIHGMRRNKADRTHSVEALASDLGIEIATQSHEGNVTWLLNLDRPKLKLPKIAIPSIKIPKITIPRLSFGISGAKVFGAPIWRVLVYTSVGVAVIVLISKIASNSNNNVRSNNIAGQKGIDSVKTFELTPEMKQGMADIVAKIGYTDSIMKLADAKYDSKNYREAMDLYWQIKDVRSEASKKIGLMYLNGYGVKQDVQQGISWIENSASPEDMVFIAKLYESGDKVEKDFEKAASWYLSAAKQGDVEGMVKTAEFYDLGKGWAKDKMEAFDWYLKAANRGNALAQYHVGIMYNNGSGTVKDVQKAKTWIKKAADNGNIDAKRFYSGPGKGKNASDPTDSTNSRPRNANEGNNTKDGEGNNNGPMRNGNNPSKISENESATRSAITLTV